MTYTKVITAGIALVFDSTPMGRRNIVELCRQL